MAKIDSPDSNMDEFETEENQENWDMVPLAVIAREVEDPYR